VSEGAPQLELDPPAAAWASLVRSDINSRDDRERLGLPTDRPVVMAGHQAGLWHPGIAAKLIAAHALADRIGGAAVWLIIDTTDDDPLRYRAPLRDESGRYREHTFTLGGDTPPAADSRGDLRNDRFAAIRAAFDRQPGDEPEAVRVTRAAIELLGCPMPTLIRSSELPQTSAFDELASRFRSQPDEMRDAYNRAVESHPAAGVNTLGEGETPFWRLTPSGARLPARQDHLDQDLQPRALVTTGVARAALCDLFIHGTGGRGYEPINDQWLPDAMGWQLAPFVTATATLRLRFEGDAVTHAQAEEARWRAHHARHHPGLLGDADRQTERDRIVRSIEELPTGDAGRAELFAELHRVLDQHQSEKGTQLAALDAEADELAERAGEQSLREDRTWPAALHEPEDLATLRDSIASAFTGPPAHAGGL
jgi:hypothetical protein